MRKFFLLLFVLGLIYLVLPGPSSIDDFPPLPGSVKSDLDGDTWQNPNNAAYFSDFQRKDITKFYKQILSSHYLFGFFLSPIRLNHRPEEAYQYVRDQQESTFLEEFFYPLRETIYVNGYEPLIENNIHKRVGEVGFVGNHVWFKENPYNSKTTLRFYTSSAWLRILVYLGMWIAAISLIKVGKKVLQEK